MYWERVGARQRNQYIYTFRSTRACLRWCKYMSALLVITFIITAGFMSRKNDLWIMNSLAFDNVVAIEESNSVSVAILETDGDEEDIETQYSFNNIGNNSNLNTRQFTYDDNKNITTTTVAFSTSEIRNLTDMTVNDTNEKGYDTNIANININEADAITNDEAANTNEAGININDASINMNEAGININEAGSNINEAGSNTNEIDNINNEAGIDTNAMDSNTNERDRNENGDNTVVDNSLYWNIPGLKRDEESNGLMDKVFDTVENENNLVLLELKKIAAERESKRGNETNYWN